MRAGQGFGRWGFIVGNVLIAFGAPVFVTSLIATFGAGRAGTPTRGEDIAAIAAGALFMIAGLIVTVTIGQARQPVVLEPLVAEPAEPVRPAVRAADWPAASALEPLPLTFNTLDDYYTAPGGVATVDDEPYFSPAPQVPRPRNARAYCEPSVTVTRSTGSRRRPPAG